MWISNKDGLAFKPVKLGHKSHSSLDSQTQFWRLKNLPARLLGMIIVSLWVVVIDERRDCQKTDCRWLSFFFGPWRYSRLRNRILFCRTDYTATSRSLGTLAQNYLSVRSCNSSMLTMLIWNNRSSIFGLSVLWSARHGWRTGSNVHPVTLVSPLCPKWIDIHWSHPTQKYPKN